MLIAGHIDEIQNDNTAQIAQAKLPGNSLGSFQIGLEDGFFQIAMADIRAGVNIDGGHCLGLINNQITTRFQGYFSTQRFLDFVLDPVQIK